MRVVVEGLNVAFDEEHKADEDEPWECLRMCVSGRGNYKCKGI